MDTQKRLLVIYLIFIYFKLEAQPRFLKIFNAGASDNISFVLQNNDSTFVMTGYTTSGISGSQEDVLLIKADKNGCMIWNKTYGYTDREYGNCVRQTIDSGYIIAGVRNYSPNHSIGFLIKTDQNGVLSWSKTFVISDDNAFSTVQQTNDGGYIIGGKVNDGTKYKALLIRTDNTGSVLWARNYGVGSTGGNLDQVLKVIQTSDSGFAVGISHAINPGTDREFSFMKINSAGDTLWSKYYSWSIYSDFKSFISTSDSGYLLTGRNFNSTYSTATFLKINAHGQIQWQNSYGQSNANIAGSDIIQTNSGDYVALLTGGILLGIDSIGGFVWAKTFPNSFSTFLLTKENDFIASGGGSILRTDLSGITGCGIETSLLLTSGNSSFSVNDYPRNPIDTPSIAYGNLTAIESSLNFTTNIICGTNCTVGINEKDLNDKITLYPIPSSGVINISLNKFTPNGTISIFNVLGNRVYSEEYRNKKEIIMCKMVKGIYFVQVITESDSWTGKIVCE